MQRQWERFWGLRWAIKGPIIAAAVVLTGALISTTETVEDEPVTTVAATTPTVTPIATPVAQAATPTATPEPDCPTPEERTYILAVAEQAGPMGRSIGEIGGAFNRAGDRPALMFDDDWRLTLVAHIVTVKIGAEQLIDLDAPASMAEIHGDTTTAAEMFIASMDLIIEGLDTLDSDALEHGAVQMLAANDYIGRATRGIQSFCA